MPNTHTFHTNPATGERLRWLLRSADTGGELVRFEMWTRPAGGVRGTHVHAHSQEHFEILSGRLILETGDDQRVLLAGERATVAAGTPHRWRNGGSDELHMIVELDHPGQFERMLEITFAAGRRGHFDQRGRMRPLAGAALVRRYPDEIAPAWPRWLQHRDSLAQNNAGPPARSDELRDRRPPSHARRVARRAARTCLCARLHRPLVLARTA